MKALPLNLRKNSFNYTQLLRGHRSCIYAQELTPEKTQYEVFKIKVKPEKVINIKGKVLKVIPEREVFPHDEAFGYWAWSIRSYEKAFKKFQKLELSWQKDL